MNELLRRLVELTKLANPFATTEEVADLALQSILQTRDQAQRTRKQWSRQTYLEVQRRRRRSVIQRASRRANTRRSRGLRACGRGSKR